MTKIDLSKAFGNPDLIKYNENPNSKTHKLSLHCYYPRIIGYFEFNCPHCNTYQDLEEEFDYLGDSKIIDIICPTCSSRLHLILSIDR